LSKARGKENVAPLPKIRVMKAYRRHSSEIYLM